MCDTIKQRLDPGSGGPCLCGIEECDLESKGNFYHRAKFKTSQTYTRPCFKTKHTNITTEKQMWQRRKKLESIGLKILM